jgi:hypothetical protein
MDQTESKKFDRFSCILSIPDIASFDVDHSNHCIKDWCLEGCIAWHPNTYNTAVRSNIFESVLKRFLMSCQKENSVRP